MIYKHFLGAFLKILFYLEDRETERDIVHPSVHFPSACVMWAGARLTSGSWNSVSVPHGWQDPYIWAVICCLLLCILAGICNLKQSQRLNPGTTVWEAGFSSGILPHMLAPRTSCFLWKLGCYEISARKWVKPFHYGIQIKPCLQIFPSRLFISLTYSS